MLGWALLFLFMACNKGPEDNMNPDDPMNTPCTLTGSTLHKMDGNRYQGTLSDSVFSYSYTFSDSLLSSIRSPDGNTRFEFTYQDETVVKRARFDGHGDLVYYDTFIYNDLNQLSKLERFDSQHASLYTYQTFYTVAQAEWVLRTNTQTQQTQYYAFTYENGNLTGFTVDGAGRTARFNSSKENPMTIQDLILTVRDLTPVDFALVSSVYPVYHTNSFGIHQPVSSTGYQYKYEPTCYNIPLKELIIRDTAFEFSYYLTHYKVND